MKIFLGSIVVLLFTLASFGAGHAKTYVERINDKEKKIQGSLKNFRFIKAVQEFPERFNATLPLNIVSTPPRAIATLHDINTGEPLESCKTPCVLHQEPNWRYKLVVYKRGYFPRRLARKSGAYASGKSLRLDLGMNYYIVRQKQRKCKQNFKANLKVDADAVPCYRHAPVMPKDAKTSGHCKVKFDVTDTGKPKNIIVQTCSEDIFRRPSKTAVTWWQYTPKVERGIAIARTGVETTITFRLTDEDGNLIAEVQ